MLKYGELLVDSLPWTLWQLAASISGLQWGLQSLPRLQMGEEQAGVLNWARAAKWASALYLLPTVQQLCKPRAQRFPKPMPGILSHTTTNVESAKSLCRIKPICYCWNTCLWIKLVFKNALDTYCEWALSNSKLDMHFLSIRDGVFENVVVLSQIFCREGEQTLSSEAFFFLEIIIE